MFERSLKLAGPSHGGGFATYCAALGTLAAGTLALFAWHVVHGYKHCGGTRPLLLGFLLPRLLTFALFGLYLLIVIPSVDNGSDTDGGYHLHHRWLAWLASLLSCWNHPLSALALAITTVAFVQGCAAYNAAPLIEDWCIWFEEVGNLRLTAQFGSNAQLLWGQQQWELNSFDLCLHHGKVDCKVFPDV